MRKRILFLIKDATHCSYLPIYGNTYWKTPNIDELAAKGSVFLRHYTGAPSTIMSNMCMSTGLDAYQSELSDYAFTHKRYSGVTVFDRAKELGYSCHIIWDEVWRSVSHAVDMYYCYGEDTTIHYIDGLRQGVGAHYIHEGFLKRDDRKTEQVYKLLEEEVINILKDGSVFLWLHIPHVINGRTGYGQDMDAFDHIVGIMRKYFDDNCIYVSSDHGNMNGERNKLGYGFDVYESEIRIPLITPRIGNREIVNDITTNIDIGTIIFDGIIPEREYILSDSAFYAQPNRKLAVVTSRFKYIYNKINDTEELFDLEFDPNETCNIMQDYIFDIDRQIRVPLRELYFYPYWDEAEKQRQRLRSIKDSIWKRGTRKEEFVSTLKYKIKIKFYYKIKKWVIKYKTRGMKNG